MRFKTSGAICMAFARIFTPNNTPNYTHLRLANELHLYPSEVYASVKRARASHFVQGPELGDRLNRSSLLEFLIHGVDMHSLPRSDHRPEVFRRAMRLLRFRKRSLMPASCRQSGRMQMVRFAATALRPSTRMSRKLHSQMSGSMNCWPWWMLSVTDGLENETWRVKN